MGRPQKDKASGGAHSTIIAAMGARKLVSIVTPCFNEEANVRAQFDRVRAAIAPFRDRYDFEHVYTDNHSGDRTLEILRAIASEHPEVHAMRFSRNIGLNRAIVFGLEHAKGDAVILIQADLQDPPELIEAFLRGWEEGHDVVYGQITGRDEGLFLRTARRAYYALVTLLGDVPIPRNAGEFRLTSRRALDAVLSFREDDLYIRGVVAQVGFSQKPIPYVRAKRAGGKSSIGIAALFSHGLNGLVSTTVVPIRAITVAGLALAAIGFAFTALALAASLLRRPLDGMATFTSIVALFTGAQLFALGIVGEYIRKIHVQSLGRPRGFIQDEVNPR